MSKLHDIYKRLRALADPSVDEAMAAAIPTADPLAARLLGLSLLERGDPAGVQALVLDFPTLPTDVQEALVRHAHNFSQALARASGSGAIHAIEIVRRCGDTRLSYLLSDALRNGNADTRLPAARCLLELAQKHSLADDRPDAVSDPLAAESLLRSLEEALTAFRRHHEAEVLLAVAAMAPRTTPGILRLLSDRGHPAVEPMRRLLFPTRERDVRRTLLVWIRLPSLAEAAVNGIQRLPSDGWNDLMRGAHLVGIGSVQRGLNRLPDPELLCPQVDHLIIFTPDRRRMLPRWIAALPLEPPRQVEALARLAHAEDKPTRLAVLQQLMALAAHPAAPTANEVISVFCSDGDPVIARIAMRHLVRCRWPGLARLLLKLVNSPHDDVRLLAGAHLAPLGFARFWDAWPRLSYAQRLAGGQALIKLDPSFHRMLGDRLGKPDRPSRLRALAVIHALNQGSWFEPALVTLAKDVDEVIASAAVRALGTGGSNQAVQVLEQALDHTDSRVRANAVESLQQLQSTRHVEKLVEMAQSDENRPRANAIHALMEMNTGDALAHLLAMLADYRPAQRASALWLVDHLGLVEVARQVAELSITDPDDGVKHRANGVIQNLIRSLQPPSPPSEPAADGETQTASANASASGSEA